MLSLGFFVLPGIAAAYLEARRRYAQRVDRALSEAGVSNKRCALELGIDEGQFSRQRSQGLLSGAALDLLDPLTDGRLAAREADARGVVTFRQWADQQWRDLRGARDRFLPAQKGAA